MTYRNVAVLMGGFSSEREISLRSGAAVADGLRQAGYRVWEVDVTGPDLALPDEADAVFIALHGEFGEDGTVQDMLERRGMPYTGSGPEASRLIFDKLRSKQAMIAAGVMTPAYEVLTSGTRRSMPLPVVVKPVRQGSSFGVHLVTDEKQWAPALEDALSFNGQVLVEEFIDGAELAMGVVGGQALPVIEIRAPDNNYDYHAKYTQGVTEYLVPAPLPDETLQICRTVALRVFDALGARGYGRLDARLAADGTLYVLELNTIPGFTKTSLLPKAAAAAGLDFPRLCDRIMREIRVSRHSGAVQMSG